MSADRDVTRIVRSWLEDGVTELPDRVRDRVLDELPATPQHRTWWSVRRSQPMNSALKAALAAAAAIAVIAVGISFLPRPNDGVGGPVASASASATPSPSPAASPSPSPSSSLPAGTFNVAGSDLLYTATLPTGWQTFDFGARRGGQPEAVFFTSLVDNTFKDTCGKTPQAPKIGPSVAELATALGKIPGTTATAPTSATIAGLDATYLEITGPATLACTPYYLWQDSPGNQWWLLDGHEHVRIWIVQTGGQRVVIAARDWPRTSDQGKTELQGILDSIRFQ